ncbi:unnamed protein product [Tilletia controversa]|nr:unnamed protein product [Tilletia controversa]
MAAAAVDALALDLRLQPATGLGPFTLGIPLWHTLDYLRSNPAHFPNVHLVLPSPSSPDSTSILLSILPHLHLVFSPLSQRLQLITFNLAPHPSALDPAYRPVRIAYTRSLVFDSTPLLHSPASQHRMHSQHPAAGQGQQGQGQQQQQQQQANTLLTRTSIHQTFGPTYPPRRIPQQDEFIVSYPGLAFTFPVSPPSAESTTTTTSTPDSLDKHTPASAFHIFAGHDLLQPAHVLLPPATSHMLPNYAAASGTPTPSRLASASGLQAGSSPAGGPASVPPACLKAVIRPEGTSTPSSTSTNTDTPITLTLGTTTTQDVLATLGAPQRRFEKVDDRVGIHSFAASASRGGGAGGVRGDAGVGGEKVGGVVELARRRMYRANAGAGAGQAEFVPGDDTEEMYDNPIFWNYFDLGIDLLFSSPALTPSSSSSTGGGGGGGGNASGANTLSSSHAVGAGGVLLKIIVHSNIPRSALFQRYHRCPWVVVPAVSGRGAGKEEDEAEEVSYHEQIDDLAALLSPTTSQHRSAPTSTDDRIELDRASDADFVPRGRRKASSPADDQLPPSSSSAGADAKGVTPLRLDVRTWLYGFENAGGREGEAVPEGGLIAEADEAGRVCSVLIY